MADGCNLPDGQHGDCDPDVCFAAQIRYMRENGGLAVHYRYGGRKAFHGPTINERREKMIAECRAQGWEPRQVNPTYDRGPDAFKQGGGK